MRHSLETALRISDEFGDLGIIMLIFYECNPRQREVKKNKSLISYK